jgi:hypothetical protein
VIIRAVIVHAVVDDSASSTSALGDAVETFIRREDAERFIEEVRGDESEVASQLWIEARELEAGGRSEPGHEDVSSQR